MAFFPKTSEELNEFLETEVSPELARSALAAIFVCLYGTVQDGAVRFVDEKEWDTSVVCEVADELSTVGLYCDQPNRDEV